MLNIFVLFSYIFTVGYRICPRPVAMVGLSPLSVKQIPAQQIAAKQNIYNHCQKSLENPLNNAAYLTIFEYPVKPDG